MQKRLLESIPCEGMKNATHIEVEVYYTKGGANYLSGGNSARGYYLGVFPVTHKNGMKSFALFSGAKKMLLPASRFSAKQMEQAVELGKAAAPKLIAIVLEQGCAA